MTTTITPAASPMTSAFDSGSTTDQATDRSTAGEWARQVRDLAEQRNAVILAHNYQLPAIQDVAHHVGDSLYLSRVAASASESTIVFCGVHFMAETAKILAPDKTVLIPDAAAGCSLAESLTADQLRAWKAENPGAVVVSYVNTTAAVKAETDICCTSSNAVEVVASIPVDRTVLFGPDQFLGAHVRRVLGRDNIKVWGGECHVHAGINGAELAARAAADPEADLYIHPECGCATSALYLAGAGAVPADKIKILSTGEMVTAARTSSATSVLVATEIGMIHQLRKAAPGIDFPGGERPGLLPVHEDDHPGETVAIADRAARRDHRGPRDRCPGPRRGGGHGGHRPAWRWRMTAASSPTSWAPTSWAPTTWAPTTWAPTWEAATDVVVVGSGVGRSDLRRGSGRGRAKGVDTDQR